MLRLGPTKLAKHFGVSRQSIYRAERAEHIRRGEDGKFNVAEARRDWLDSTPLAMGGIHSRLKDEPSEPHPPAEHPFLTALQQAWGMSLRSMALCLRELDTFKDEERHFACLSIMFLLQWKIVSGELGAPWGDSWDDSLTFSGDMALLIREGKKGVKAGSVELEAWLKKQPRISIKTEG